LLVSQCLNCHHTPRRPTEASVQPHDSSRF